jgi:hypothetical protein
MAGAGLGAIVAGVVLAAIVGTVVGPARPSSIALIESQRPSVGPPSTAPSSGPSLPVPSAEPSVAPSPTPTATAPVASATPSLPSDTDIPATLPIKGSGRDLGTQIRMAPGAEGGLFVSVPGRGGDVLTLLDASGKPRQGWPILLRGMEACDRLLPVFDGSVRIICIETPPEDEDGLNGVVELAFAFGPDGRRLDGWPVAVDEVMAAGIVGDGLRLIARPYAGDVPIDEMIHMTVVGPNGNVQNGVDIPFG